MKKTAVLAFALLAGLVVAHGGWGQEKSPPPATTAQVHKDVVPRKWLKKKTTVKEAEQAHLVSDPRLGSKPVPFGFINDRWEELKAQMRPGDELWEFESSPASWADLAGRAGICLVRKGQIIDAIITRMN